MENHDPNKYWLINENANNNNNCVTRTTYTTNQPPTLPILSKVFLDVCASVFAAFDKRKLFRFRDMLFSVVVEGGFPVVCISYAMSEWIFFLLPTSIICVLVDVRLWECVCCDAAVMRLQKTIERDKKMNTMLSVSRKFCGKIVYNANCLTVVVVIARSCGV